MQDIRRVSLAARVSEGAGLSVCTFPPLKRSSYAFAPQPPLEACAARLAETSRGAIEHDAEARRGAKQAGRKAEAEERATKAKAPRSILQHELAALMRGVHDTAAAERVSCLLRQGRLGSHTLEVKVKRGPDGRFGFALSDVTSTSDAPDCNRIYSLLPSAQLAGLQLLDKVVACNGVRVPEDSSMMGDLSKLGLGQPTVRLTVERPATATGVHQVI